MEEDYEKKPSKGIKTFIFVLLLAFVLGGALYDKFYGGRVLEGLLTEAKNAVIQDSASSNKDKRQIIELEPSGKSLLKTFGNKFMLCTKDGVKFFNSIKDQKWNETYTMTNPVAISEGEYVAVAEYMGQQIYVYNSNGPAYNIPTDGNIERMALNENGYLAVILNNKTEYTISIYDNKGNLWPKGRHEQDANVYPIDVDISSDNRVFAVSYLDLTDIGAVTKVLFFYMNYEEGKDFQDSMFASQHFDDAIAPYIKYLKDNKLVVVTDKAVALLSNGGELLWNVEMTNEIDAVGTDEAENIVLALGNEIPGKEGLKKGTLQWLNLNGEVKQTIEVGGAISYLQVQKEGVIAGAGKVYKAYSHSGKLLWEHKATQDVSDILFMDKANIVLYVTRGAAEILDMDKKEEKKETDAASTEGTPAESAEAPENSLPASSVPEPSAPASSVTPEASPSENGENAPREGNQEGGTQ